MALNLIKKWFLKRSILSDKDDTGVTKSTALDLDAYIQHRIDSTPAVLPYKVYTALLTQSGTDAPVATVLENTLGGTVSYLYNSAGQYSVVATGLLTLNKTKIDIDGVNAFDGVSGTASLDLINISVDTFDMMTFDATGSPFDWSSFPIQEQISIEIRVYP